MNLKVYPLEATNSIGVFSPSVYISLLNRVILNLYNAQLGINNVELSSTINFKELNFVKANNLLKNYKMLLPDTSFYYYLDKIDFDFIDKLKDAGITNLVLAYPKAEPYKNYLTSDKELLLNTINKYKEDFIITLDILNASLLDFSEIEQDLKEFIDAGIKRVRFSDNKGILNPLNLKEKFLPYTQLGIDLEVLFANSLSLATANLLKAIEVARDNSVSNLYYLTSLMGVGPAAGIVDTLISYFAINESALEKVEFADNIDKSVFWGIYSYFSGVADLEIKVDYPYIGDNIYRFKRTYDKNDLFSIDKVGRDNKEYIFIKDRILFDEFTTYDTYVKFIEDLGFKDEVYKNKNFYELALLVASFTKNSYFYEEFSLILKYPDVIYTLFGIETNKNK